MAVTDPVVIGDAQNKFIKDSTSKALGLYRPSYAGGGSYWSARHEGDDSSSTYAYEVPSDKIFVLLSFNWTCHGTTGQIILYEHTSPDTSGGTEVWRGSGIADIQCFSGTYYREFPAGTYLNMKCDATDLNWNLFGVEIDA